MVRWVALDFCDKTSVWYSPSEYVVVVETGRRKQNNVKITITFFPSELETFHLYSGMQREATSKVKVTLAEVEQ